MKDALHAVSVDTRPFSDNTRAISDNTHPEKTYSLTACRMFSIRFIHTVRGKVVVRVEDFLTVVWRTIFLYVLIIIVLRLMGKRELGQLSVIDLVISVLIAEVAAFALDDPDSSLFLSVVPILLLLIIQVTASFISLKSKKFRDVVDGDPAVIIREGVIDETEMRKQRYNLDDLLQQLREQQVGSVTEVEYAILEPSGNLSVFKKDGSPPILPLITDGFVQDTHLMLIGKSRDWLFEEIKKSGYAEPDHIFFCSLEAEGLHIQAKKTG